jgi:hypothetical protein
MSSVIAVLVWLRPGFVTDHDDAPRDRSPAR